MTDTHNGIQPNLLARFRDGPTIMERWDAARELMAARKLIPALDTEDFRFGFAETVKEVEIGNGVSRLIAVDQASRRSSRRWRKASLQKALTSELPPASLLADSKNLPTAAKPAEFRENLAIALKYASGEWVIPYGLRALVEEDRSQRSRLELVRQLTAREPSIDKLLGWLVAPPRQTFNAHADLEIAAARLRDLARLWQMCSIKIESTSLFLRRALEAAPHFAICLSQFPEARSSQEIWTKQLLRLHDY